MWPPSALWGFCAESCGKISESSCLHNRLLSGNSSEVSLPQGEAPPGRWDATQSPAYQGSESLLPKVLAVSTQAHLRGTGFYLQQHAIFGLALSFQSRVSGILATGNSGPGPAQRRWKPKNPQQDPVRPKRKRERREKSWAGKRPTFPIQLGPLMEQRGRYLPPGVLQASQGACF